MIGWRASRGEQIALGASIGALALAAWQLRFIQDDAFISFRYAWNLVHGWGLVWNPGEAPVEGYTNFLWTLLMAIPISLRLDPVLFSQLLGVSLFVGSLSISYTIAKLLLSSGSAAVATVVLLGSNYSFVCYATGGLETQLQALLFTATAMQTLRLVRSKAPPAAAVVGLSSLYGLGLLTRLDSALVVGPSACFVLWRVWHRRPDMGGEPGWRSLATTSLLLAGPLLLLVVPWLAWKLWYYGDLLPNSFYSKVGPGVPFALGLGFLASFFWSYWLIAIAPLVISALVRARAKMGIDLIFLSSVVGLWLAYLVKLGGGFMEFRLLVPILPLLFVLIAWVIFVAHQHRALHVAACALVLAGSIHHARTFEWDGLIEPISQLARHMDGERENWRQVGRSLGERFDADESGITIATSAAGAIPYYSGLRTIDMLGINDRWIAENGVAFTDWVGHQKAAPLHYLVAQKVNLVLGHPRLLPRDTALSKRLTHRRFKRLFDVAPEPSLLENAMILSIPIDEDWQMTALYLVPHPLVDELIRSEELDHLQLGFRSRARGG